MLFSPGGTPDFDGGAIELRQARHALRDKDRHVVFRRHVPDDAGQRLLLAPNFQVVRALSQGASPIELGSVADRVGNVVISLSLSSSPTLVDDEGKRNLPLHPHLS